MTYGGNDAFRGTEEIDVEQFISVKGFKAKGKRLTTWQIASIEELEPLRFPEPEEEPEETEEEEENLDPDAGKSQQQVFDELTGQLNLFTEHVAADTRAEQVILPLRAGLTVIRKK